MGRRGHIQSILNPLDKKSKQLLIAGLDSSINEANRQLEFKGIEKHGHDTKGNAQASAENKHDLAPGFATRA